MSSPIPPVQDVDPWAKKVAPPGSAAPADVDPWNSPAARAAVAADTSPIADPTAGYDAQSGAPLKVRLALAASGPNDQLAVAKKYLRNARMTPAGLAYDGPNGPTLVTPKSVGIGNILTAPGRFGTGLGAAIGGILGTPADIVTGPAGTMTGGAAGGFIGGQAGNVIQKVLALIAGKPGQDTRSPVALAQSGAQDAVSGLAQEGLGLAGGRWTRGVANMGARTAARTAAADAAGAHLTLGQTLDAPVLKFLENANAVIPTGSGIMRRFGAGQAADLGTEAQRIASNIAGGGVVPSTEEAGAAAQTAASRIGKSFEAERQPLAETFRNAVDAKFPPATPTANAPTNAELLAQNPGDPMLRKSYSDAIKNGTADQWAKQVPGAAKGPVTGVPLTNTEALVQELQGQAAKKSFKDAVSPALAKAQAIVADAKDGTLDAADLLRHRTDLGQSANFTGPLTAPDAGQTYIKKLYGALSADIDAAAQAAGPEAQKALDAHDALVTEFRGGGKNSPGAFWQRVENAPTPEAAFDLITNHPNDAAMLAEIRKRMTDQEFQPIAARHFLNLGNATPGAGGPDVFSPESFMTKFRGKSGMTDAVRSGLYADANGAMPEGLDNFESTLKNVKSSGAFRNPSGTAGMLQGTQFLRRITDLLNPTTGAAGQAVMMGADRHNPVALLRDAVGPMVTAKTFTTPAIVRGASGLAKSIGKGSGNISDLLDEWFPPARP